MKLNKKRCAACRQWFRLNPRAVRDGLCTQRYCSEDACRKARKKEAQGKWVANNPDYFKGDTHKNDCRDWAGEHPGYSMSYRNDHPDYVEANRQRQKIRDKRRLFLAKKDGITQNPLRYLEGIRLLAQKNLAKKDGFRFPLEGILDFLVVKESLAKKDVIALTALVGG